MTIKSLTPLNQQWRTLHDSIERYEQYALIIKLVSIVLSLVSISLHVTTLTILFFLCVLWVQEGIWKTYQTRLSEAIMKLESRIDEAQYDDKEDVPSKNVQPIYNQWHKNRPNSGKLVKEYINNSLKPTVIFPYAPLMIILLAFN